jgi:Na+/melibiose symporter-like transporter
MTNQAREEMSMSYKFKICNFQSFYENHIRQFGALAAKILNNNKERIKWSSRSTLGVNVFLLMCSAYLFLASGPAPEKPIIEWKDYVTILLTVVTIVMGAAALLIAMVAIWGYTSLREHAENTARKAGEEAATKTAREVAQAVAARTALDALNSLDKSPTSDEANALSAALMSGEEKVMEGAE